MFVDPDNDDLRLGSCSPSTDAGDNDAVPAGVTTDLDGNPRFVDDAGVPDTGNSGDAGPPVVDMGAYERQVDSLLVINVPADFATIQEAIDSVCSAEIIVQEGIYFENIDFLGKAITLRSTDPTDPAVVAATIIDGGGVDSVVTCDGDEGSDTILSGFTITGGNATEGGGMRNSAASPTVTHCTFTGNTADLGGGMNNSISSSPTVANCTFSGNIAAEGGGMYNDASSPTVTNCTFSGSTASNNGGGLFNVGRSNPTVTNCTISGNEAVGGSGGGMYNIFLSSPTVTNCTFSGNSAVSGGGMYNDFGSSPTLTNCVLWADSPDEIFNDDSTPTVTYSNVQGGFAGNGNIDADPLFVDPDNDDLRFLPGSPCIDAASNDDVPADTADLDGDGDTDEPTPFDLDGSPRFHDDPTAPDCPQDPGNCGTAPIVDMGPYESQATKVPCEGDANGDGAVDPLDSGYVLARFGCPVGTGDPSCDAADQNGDGAIDPLDSGFVLARFGPCE